MKQNDMWQNDGAVNLCGDRDFWKGVMDELAERCDGDAAAMFDALEAVMTEKLGGAAPGWLRIKDVCNKR